MSTSYTERLKRLEERFIVEADSQGIDEIIGRMRKE